MIAVNVLVFLLVNVPIRMEGGDAALYGVFSRWGFDQAHPLSIQLFTSMFLHAGIAHLAGNMWMLYIVGDNVEDKLGRGRFLLLYLAGGLVAAWAFVVTSAFTPEVLLTKVREMLDAEKGARPRARLTAVDSSS